MELVRSYISIIWTELSGYGNYLDVFYLFSSIHEISAPYNNKKPTHIILQT